MCSAARQFNESWNRSLRKHWISVRVIVFQVDVLIGELVQMNRSEKWLRRLNQQNRLRKTVVVEAASEMNRDLIAMISKAPMSRPRALRENGSMICTR